jgi:hypothetical protein
MQIYIFRIMYKNTKTHHVFYFLIQIWFLFLFFKRLGCMLLKHLDKLEFFFIFLSFLSQNKNK